MHDYYDPDGSKGINAIYLVVSAQWCVPCQGEAKQLSRLNDLYKPTGKKVLRINVHTLQGGTKLEKDPDNRDSDELSRFKDWGIGQYWLDVLAFTAGQMSRQDPGPQAMTPLWDIVTIGGDYNAFLDRTDRWYYPGAMLPALFVNDSRQRSLDHLQHGHGSDVKVARRWTQAINSDHSLHLVERTILNVPDFPRQ